MAIQLGVSVGTATTAQVLTGYSFSNSTQQNVTGAMPNQGALTTPDVGRYPAGYYSSVVFSGWLTETSDTTARAELAAAYDSSANLTYAIDGSTSANIATVTAYSHSANSWTAEASDTTARDELAAAYDSSANLTYAIDGYDGGYLATVTAYSHSANSWTAEASDTTTRFELAAAYDSSANLTYAIDGYDGGYLATVTAFIN